MLGGSIPVLSLRIISVYWGKILLYYLPNAKWVMRISIFPSGSRHYSMPVLGECWAELPLILLGDSFLSLNALADHYSAEHWGGLCPNVRSSSSVQFSPFWCIVLRTVATFTVSSISSSLRFTVLCLAFSYLQHNLKRFKDIS